MFRRRPVLVALLLGMLLAAVPAAATWTITADTTWTAGVVVTQDTILVPAGVTLTLEAGVIVKFAFEPDRTYSNDCLIVEGSLVAAGTADTPVVLTSYRDDAWGGDTNGDGDATTPSPNGDWRGLRFTGESLQLDHCLVLSAWQIQPAYDAANVVDGPAVLRNCTFARSQDDLLDVRGTGVTLTGCSFATGHQWGRLLDCRGTDVVVDGCSFDGSAALGGAPWAAIWVKDGSTTVTGSTFTGFQQGIASDVPIPSPTGNTFRDCDLPISCSIADPLDPTGNTLLDGTPARLGLRGTVSGELTLEPAPEGWVYQLSRTTQLPPGSRLTIAAGTHILMEEGSTGWTVHGTLVASGTAEAPVLLTSVEDPTGADAAATRNWLLVSLGELQLDHCLVAHGTIKLSGAATLGDCTFRYRDYAAIRVDLAAAPGDSGPVVTGCAFHDVADGVQIVRGPATVTGCSFTDCEWPVTTSDQGHPHLADLNVTGEGYRGVRLDVWQIAHSCRWTGDDLGGLPLVADPAHDYLTITEGDTLGLGPGAVLKIAGGENHTVFVSGMLRAEGTADAPAVITSLYDDAWGGDTDGGDVFNPYFHSWNGIHSTGRLVLRHAVVRRGGRDDPMVRVAAGTATVADCVFEEVYRTQWELRSQTSQGVAVRRCTFRSDGQLGGGAFCLGSRDTVQSCTFERLVSPLGGHPRLATDNRVTDCLHGLVLYGTGGEIRDNVLDDVGVPFVLTDGARVDVTANTLAGNTPPLTYLQGTFPQDVTLGTWDRDTWTYVPRSGFNVAAGRTLTLEPGVVLKPYPGQQVVCQGSLVALGTEERPIVVTSWHDDTVGVDTDGADDTADPAPGDWSRIEVCETTRLAQAILRYGGDYPLLLSGAAAHLEQCDLATGTLLSSSADTTSIVACLFREAAVGVNVRGNGLLQDCVFREVERPCHLSGYSYYYTPGEMTIVGNDLVVPADRRGLEVVGIGSVGLVAGNTVRGGDALVLDWAVPRVEANLLTGDGGGTGITLLDTPYTNDRLLRLTGNTVRGFGCGLEALGRRADRQTILRLSANRFTGNAGSGVRVGTADTTRYLPPAVTLAGNDLSGNGAWALYAGGCPDPAAQVVVARRNWWGATGAGVADLVHDQADDPAAPLVLLDPVLATPPAAPDTVRWAAPAVLAAELLPGEIRDLALWIGHRDSAAVTVTATVAEDGDRAGDWLSVAPAGTTLAAGRSAPLAVTVSAAGLAEGDHAATISLAWDGAGTTTVPVSVTVARVFVDGIDPGRILHPDEVVTLSWRVWQPDDVTAVDLDVSTDGGTTFTLPVAAGLAGVSSFDWTVPPGVSSEECRVRIVVHRAGGGTDTGVDDALFTILDRDVVPNEDHGDDDTPPAPPARLALLPPCPNPFNPATTLAFDLPRPGRAELALYDLAGRRVAVLADGSFTAGRHTVTWHGRDAAGRPVASGTYLARLVTDTGVRVQRLTLAR